MSRPTLDTARSALDFAYGAFTLSGWLSQNHSAIDHNTTSRSEPQHARTLVWALPVSLAATPRITCCFLFLRLLRCFSSPGSPPYTMDSCTDDCIATAGFPHSDIPGSMDICSSPRLFAAYHVFHRLLVPRHSPCALPRLTSLMACFFDRFFRRRHGCSSTSAGIALPAWSGSLTAAALLLS